MLRASDAQSGISFRELHLGHDSSDDNFDAHTPGETWMWLASFPIWERFNVRWLLITAEIVDSMGSVVRKSSTCFTPCCSVKNLRSDAPIRMTRTLRSQKRRNDQNSPTTSLPRRVTRLASVFSRIEALTKRADPSHMATCVPPS